MTNLIENIKAKIEEARIALKTNANQKYNDSLKKEIETHITEMDQLLVKVQGAGDKADAEFKQAVTESVAKLEKMLQR